MAPCCPVTLACALTCAPYWSSNETMASSPFSTARCSAVGPVRSFGPPSRALMGEAESVPCESLRALRRAVRTEVDGNSTAAMIGVRFCES